MTYVPTERDGKIRQALINNANVQAVPLYAKWLAFNEGSFYHMTIEETEALQAAIKQANQVEDKVEFNGVTIHWFEGPVEMVDHKGKKVSEEFTYDTLEDANKFLVRLAEDMKADGDMGYCKVKFTMHIGKDDEHAYTGRFDLHALGERQETTNNTICFMQWAKDFVTYLAKTDENAREYLKMLESL